jgi:hypothetical protein
MCPLGCRVPEGNPPYLGAIPKVQLAQAKRFATGVLEHYNKRKNVRTIYLLHLEKNILSILDW